MKGRICEDISEDLFGARRQYDPLTATMFAALVGSSVVAIGGSISSSLALVSRTSYLPNRPGFVSAIVTEEGYVGKGQFLFAMTGSVGIHGAIYVMTCQVFVPRGTTLAIGAGTTIYSPPKAIATALTSTATQSDEMYSTQSEAFVVAAGFMRQTLGTPEAATVSMGLLT